MPEGRLAFLHDTCAAACCNIACAGSGRAWIALFQANHLAGSVPPERGDTVGDMLAFAIEQVDATLRRPTATV